MEVFKVTKKLEALECEKLLKKHIEYESKIDINIDAKANVDDFFDRMAGNPDAILLAAKQEEKIVGYLHGFIKNNYKNISKNDIAVINIVYVDEKYRRQGVGKALLNSFYDWVKFKNTNYIEVETYINNENAIKFYEKSDFSTIKVTYRKKL